jgi:cob(I)alamin adenosyltransferase
MTVDNKLPLPSPGDEGTSGLPGGLRVRKSDAIIRAGGSLDELTAALGLLKVLREGQAEVRMLESIQRGLLDIGAGLATGKEPSGSDLLALLEREMDRLNGGLPPLHRFILPGGNEAAARAHWARTVCRRVECDWVQVQDLYPERVSAQSLAVLNRLSAYLFALARIFDI